MNLKNRVNKLEQNSGGGEQPRFICYKRDDGYFKDGRLYSEAEIEKIGETHELVVVEYVVNWRNEGDKPSDDPNTITVQWED
jgi:hypothetical protein